MRKIKHPIIDGNRFCPKCNTTKPITDFFKRRKNNNGYHTICKICATATHKLKYKTNEEYRKQRIKNTTDSKRKKAYGVDRDLFKFMFEQQSGLCKICQVVLDGRSRRYIGHLDHCHVTKKVRGILCAECNTGLGLFRDNENFLLSAITYLRS